MMNRGSSEDGARGVREEERKKWERKISEKEKEKVERRASLMTSSSQSQWVSLPHPWELPLPEL